MDSNDRRNQGFNNPVHELADWMQFTLFKRFLEGPKSITVSPTKFDERSSAPDVKRGMESFTSHSSRPEEQLE
jgi:hypothetical protein